MSDCTTWAEVSQLFNATDIAHMQSEGIDLSNCADTARNAAAILQRVTATDATRMPPPPAPAWTADQVACLKSWIAAGTPCPSAEA